MANKNGLISTKDVASTGEYDSNFFIRKDDPLIVNTLIANDVICDTLDLNGGILTTTGGGTVLTLNGNPIGGVATITGTIPINVTSGANPIVSLNNSGVVAGTYPVADVTVNAKGLITTIVAGTIPPNDDWSNFPAQTNVNMNNFLINTLATPLVATDASTKGYVDSNFVNLTTAQTVGGIKTFTSIPVCATLPTNNDQLSNKQYVDSAVSASALANVLIAGNTAGANQIDMNNNKIINLATPTLVADATTKLYVDTLDGQNVKLTGNQSISGIKTFTTLPESSVAPTTNNQFTNKAYVDGVVGSAPTLATVLTAGNIASGDINMNDFDISSVNDITMSGLVPTITATNVLGNLTISSAATMNLATAGQMTLASGGILSLGGATHTSIEDIRITNNAITKETGAGDITIANVASVTNSAAPLALSGTDVDIQATTGNVVIEGITVNGTTITAISGADNVSVSPTEIKLNDASNSNTLTKSTTEVLAFNGTDVGRVDTGVGFGLASLLLGAGTTGSLNALRVEVQVSGVVIDHETTTGANLPLTLKSEGIINLQAGYNDTGATTATPINITSTGAGGAVNPTLRLTNTNATGSVALEIYKNKPTAGTNGDILFNQSVFGKDSGNAKQEYTRISHTIRASAAGVEDGSIEFGCFLNGVNTNFLQINGNDEQVNILKDVDLTNQNLLNVKQIALGSLTGFGTAGQVITSRGPTAGTTVYSNPNQTAPVGTSVGGQSIDSTTINFNFAVGAGLTPSFIPVPNNRYRVDFSVSLEGPNQGILVIPRVGYNSVDYFGDIYRDPALGSGANPYVSEPTTASGLHYHSINFTDYFTIPISASNTISFSVGILSTSGTATVAGGAKVGATISPCFD
jgi:hypothetical protein